MFPQDFEGISPCQPGSSDENFQTGLLGDQLNPRKVLGYTPYSWCATVS